MPKTEALVPEFKPEDYAGKWYISAGLNKAFDTFDCQYHRFESPADNKLVGNLQWRIKDPVAGTNFVTRYTVQTFDMDEKRQGILYNHDNEFLHYQDDWYILAARDQQYVVVYYRGSNDAWDGYGGAVVYTREPAFPTRYAGEVDAALGKVGLKFADFTLTDNTCRAAETRALSCNQTSPTAAYAALRPPWGVMGPADALAAGWWPMKLHLDNLFQLYARCYTSSVASHWSPRR